MPRLSPLEVSAQYLKHIVEAWNAAPGRKDADKLEEQTVVVTVPASFDDVARNLTVEAAKQAGLKNVTLLEEPQAAFYAWLGTHSPQEAGMLKPGMRCLVVDVGGGTTDFSLIRAGEEKGELTFVREAVGDHLLARRRQHGPRAREGRRDEAPRRPARRGPVRRAGAGVPRPRRRRCSRIRRPPSFPVTVMGRAGSSSAARYR